ncbi:MAG TPA: zinc ribbon domain-containing protein [Candidatus Faecalibacterium intestinipullorum]|mgnify:CR=1 FL=1|uniref:Zinc-ribbon domain-containing protein n=1 Tax=Faecalibacterium gallinarum TaxID=2903556 RepID=A0AA37IY58_9FIRM|nr:zinc ribbon domain-containing protein [Faecalibacterium gallinarum]GJN64430.1 hypothetical protein JCM17207_10550 [Faecalibacterium gallinarum]HIV51352.1 zinc ribbon domain-containing protein [Candidatus Faecalibacterium intestinipullorum]
MDFNKLKEKGLEYVEKGRLAAADLTEKGRIQTRILTDQAKLIRAQRQLGVLVYSLAKGNEENQPLVDKYIDMIGAIEQEIAQLKAKLTPAEVQEVERAVADVEIDPADVMDQTEDEAEPMETAGADHCCPQCGAPVEPGSLFCNKCGAQL